MLKIPSFKHPSNSSLATVFRQPNVEDALSFIDLDPELEEQVTTEYLNSLLVSTNNFEDTAKWTAGDRVAALWWLFINIMPETELTFSYHCEYCNSAHIEDINLMDLDGEITTLKSLPKLSKSLMFKGVLKDVAAKPLDGEAMAILEEYRLDLAEAIEEEKAQLEQSIRARMKLIDLALSIDVGDLDFDGKLELINTQTIPEMLKLISFVNAAKEELHHGLHTQLVDGKRQVVSPPLECQSEDNKEGVSSRLLINFRSHDFIPAI